MPKYAAVDIGSNSVRMEAAEVSAQGALRVLAADREVTRLGESVFRAGRISSEAMTLTCDALARMARTYQKLDLAGIRAVATSAVRDARNQEEFLMRAAKSVGAPVEVISGGEEARLIHLGVHWRWPQGDRHVLIVDIGGGSAELILSDNGRLVEAHSKPLGAVRLTGAFLKDDPPTETQLQQLEDYISEKLRVPVERIGKRRIDRVIATSATAAAAVGAINRVSKDDRDKTDRLRATSAQLRKLYRTVAGLDCAARRKLPGIGPKRAEIIVPGVAVLRRVLEDFRQPALVFSISGVRDGIIADLFTRGVGREAAMLDREQRRTVEELARRFGVSLTHARRVADLAHSLFIGLDNVHGLPRVSGRLLEAAAILMDTGHYVSDTRHHRHSHYLIVHSALPGFTDPERHIVASLCRFHRKSMPTDAHAEFLELSAEERTWVVRLIPLLRLADALDRSRKQVVNGVECRAKNGTVELRLDAADRANLEVWAVGECAEVFREVYGMKVTVTRS